MRAKNQEEETEKGGAGNDTMKVAKERKVRRGADVLLRVLALVATLVAIIVISVSVETKLVPITVLPNLPTLNIPATAKWQYSSAFVYFIVANSIACAYAACSLMLSMLNLAETNGIAMAVLVLDLITAALLFSGNGAAAAIGVVGYKGNVHVRWEEVCSVFDKYCRYTAASIAVSLVGAVVFLVLILLKALHFHKRSL